jgi:hypothetical protein
MPPHGWRVGARQFPSVELEGNARTVMTPQQIVERRIEQRLEMPPEGFLEIAGVEQGGQLIGQRQSYGRAPRRRQTRRRDPFPGRTMP